MNYSNTVQNDQEYALGNAEPNVPPLFWANSWPIQESYPASPDHDDSSDFPTNIPQWSLFEPHLEGFRIQTDSCSNEIPNIRTGLSDPNLLTNFGHFEGFTNNALLDISIPEGLEESKPLNCDAPSRYSLAASEPANASLPLEFYWSTTDIHGVKGQFTLVEASSQTTSASKFAGPSTTSLLFSRSNSSPPTQTCPSDQKSTDFLSGVPKYRILPLRHSRTFSQGPNHSQCGDCHRSFTLRKDLERHKSSIHAQQKWLCSITGCEFGHKGFKRKDKLLQHLRTHIEANNELGKVQYSTLSECSQDTDSVVLNDTVNVRYNTQEYKDTQIATFNSREQTAGTQSEPQTLPPSAFADSTSHSCDMRGCGKAFVNQHDLARHKKTLHVDRKAGEGYRCTSCTRSDKIWMRLDNFKKHLRHQHNITHVEEYVKRSSRSKRGVDTTVSFAVVTPDTFPKKE